MLSQVNHGSQITQIGIRKTQHIDDYRWDGEIRGTMLTPEARLRDFPSLTDRAYLNTAAEGIPPPSVAEALARYARDKQVGMDGRKLHADEWERTKSLVAEFYGLSAAEVGICSCSSEAYNLAAMALRLRPGDEVVINDLDFPSGATPWLQEGCPATVKVWRSRQGALRTEDLARNKDALIISLINL